MTRLCRCSECKYSDTENIDFASGKPYCDNWKQYLDCGCFHGSPRNRLPLGEIYGPPHSEWEILTALEICGDLFQRRGCSECPYFHDDDPWLVCRARLARDAANILREKGVCP